MGVSPSEFADQCFDNRRPDGAGHIASAGRDSDGNPASALEPMGDIGDDRAKADGRAKKPDQNAVDDSELNRLSAWAERV